MKITYINGFRFKQAILAGANHVIDAQGTINQLNVFPVPDADTGSNMAATLSAIAKNILHHNASKLCQISKRVADSALTGARGNSGSILAQFFQSVSLANTTAADGIGFQTANGSASKNLPMQ